MESVAETKPAELEPTVLDEDKGSVVSGGEEYTLKSIINKEFAEERWLECEKLLKNFLSVHRSDEIETRARFYLGQVLYFQGKSGFLYAVYPHPGRSLFERHSLAGQPFPENPFVLIIH